MRHKTLKKFRVILKNIIKSSICAICKIYIPENFVSIYDMLIVCHNVNTVQLVHVTPPVKIIGQKPDTILVVS